MTAPVTVIIGSEEILLPNRTYPNEVEQFVAGYRSGAPIPPVVVADYKGQRFAVNGAHRLTALEELIRANFFDPMIVLSKHVLTINGDSAAEQVIEVREALDWLESNNLNPADPKLIGLDDAIRGGKYQNACRVLREYSPDQNIKNSLASDAGTGWGW